MVLSVTGHIVSAVLCFFLCWLAFKTLTLLQAYGMVTPALGMPVYVPYIPMGVGCFLMATRSLIRARQMLLGGSLDPKGDKS
jgi:TRAP-type C4-dicarboxylate transport system permease small subunit